MTKHYLSNGGTLGWAWAGALWLVAGCGSVVIEPTGGGPGEGGAGGGGAGGETASAGGASTSSTGPTTSSTCACATDADCGGAGYCVACACVECAAGKPCEGGLWCCGNDCVDLSSDGGNCGSCGEVCEGANATMDCAGGQCAIAECDAGFADCDGLAANGCESDPSACACPGCECAEGDVDPCYVGPPGTLGVGSCTSGIQVCVDGLWGLCEGSTTPVSEVCDGLDNDCDGAADEDGDGDGWTACDGDCCDDPVGCPSPKMVNPGALEVPGNGVDDDCNPGTLDADPLPTCSLASFAEMDLANQTPTSELKLTKAMDLCVFTQESPAMMKEKTWGVISVQFTLADGSTAVKPKGVQAGVLPNYGPNVGPLFGETMAALSSGTARAEGSPGYAAGYNAQTLSGMPPAFLAANGGESPPGCGPDCAGDDCVTAFDPVGLHLRIRTPTNMGGFHFGFRFYTAEYPESVCTSWNDFFVALLQSQAQPMTLNLGVDDVGNTMSVNDALFSSCQGCPDGTDALVGTGIGGLNGALNGGAATSWHTSAVEVLPGEIIDLELVVWDAADHNVSSLVLLDAFTWVPESYFLFD